MGEEYDKKFFKATIAGFLCTMLFSVVLPAATRAEDAVAEQGTKKVTLLKLLLTKDELANGIVKKLKTRDMMGLKILINLQESCIDQI